MAKTKQGETDETLRKQRKPHRNIIQETAEETWLTSAKIWVIQERKPRSLIKMGKSLIKLEDTLKKQGEKAAINRWDNQGKQLRKPGDKRGQKRKRANVKLSKLLSKSKGALLKHGEPVLFKSIENFTGTNC
jgi:hypothetical protein